MSGDAQKIMIAVQRRHRRTLNLETGHSHCQGARRGECDFRDGSLDDFEAHVAAEVDKALGGLTRETVPAREGWILPPGWIGDRAAASWVSGWSET
ncbi:hypothetical protein FGG24_gp64 [Mycobacterium phage JC27]|uniref:Uncharacterized protein n=1 Tax=Mycobacterium phage JC27 TaxID=2922210 RepID=G1D3B3_9CAUD|nr:hypothetical protein FGG24_gp64 [Mycobacterium phage JC27]AEK09259.1 hypothetical protein PBI_JC27_64 [Mycobacterium phage JC27]